MKQHQHTTPAVTVQTTTTVVWAKLLVSTFTALVLTAIAAMIAFSLLRGYLPRTDMDANIVRNKRDATKTDTFTATYYVKYLNMTPDGIERPVLTLNGNFPGPTIIVKRGTIINVKICNQFNEATSVHWHGMLQRQTNEMDGVPGVTQCLILPGQCYLYKFSTINQSPGTYWYHSHAGVQLGDGLQGGLVITDPDDPWGKECDSEDTLLLTEWNHTPFYALLEVFLSINMLEPIPDTALINGIGQLENCSATSTCKYHRTFIKSGTTLRLRLINTSLYSKITVTVDQHDLRVVEADGIPLNGEKVVRRIRLNPGQRYSVLITAKKNHAPSYWIRSSLHPYYQGIGVYANATQPTASAILQYTTDSNSYAPIIVPSMGTFHNDDNIIYQSIREGEIFADEKGLVTLPGTDRVFPTGKPRTLIYNLTVLNTMPHVHLGFNNVYFTHPANQSILAALLSGNDQAVYTPSVTKIEKGQIIDMVINNDNFLPHPIHLHGHDSWVVGLGSINDGFSNGTAFPNSTYNTTYPLQRDTISVNPYTYLIVRFVANNPGVWIMHCHNDWHLNLGMALVFVETPAEVKQYYLSHTSTTSIPRTCQAMGSGH